MTEKTYKKKIVLIGEGAVGKTSLIKKFVYNQFNETYISTIGTVTSNKKVQLGDTTLDFDVWDTAGQTIHHPSLNLRHYSGAHGAIAVFDTTRFDTLLSRKENPLTQKEEIFGIYRYIKDIYDVVGRVPFVLVGNKYDLIKNFEEFNIRKVDDIKKGDEQTTLEFEEWMKMMNHRVIEYYEANYPSDAQDISFRPVTETDLTRHEEILRKKLLLKEKIPCFVSSAKTGENVNVAFQTLAELIYQRMESKNG